MAPKTPIGDLLGRIGRTVPGDGPLGAAIDELAAGAQTELGATARQSLRRAARAVATEIVTSKQAGNNREARALVDAFDREVLDLAGGWSQPPDPELDRITDPRALAARIPRR